MKLLLYCKKSKPYLTSYINKQAKLFFDLHASETLKKLNGTIPCECDYELEEIYYGCEIDDFWTKTCGSQKIIKHNLLKQSCLTDDEMHQYLQPKDSYYGDCGKAIHIKNLKVFKEPKKLSDYYYGANKLNREPKNMMIVQELVKSERPIGTYFINGTFLIKDYVLIGVKPELLCKILNGECTIIVKKKVLKEMK